MMSLVSWSLAIAMQVLAAPTTDQVVALGASLPIQPSVQVIEAITRAVQQDEQPPLLGSYRAEAALMLTYAYFESRFKICAVGDHGRSLGLFQMQRLNKEIACDPSQAARIWLIRAHEAYEQCRGNLEEARLASLASGNCQHARVLTTHRVRVASAL